MDDCDPKDLFGKHPESGDIFEHFANQAKNFNKKR